MTSTTPPVRASRIVLAITCAGALAFTASCSSQGNGASDESAAAGNSSVSAAGAGVDQSARELLPADIRDAGEITIAVNPEAPPIKFLNKSQKLDGAIIDLMNATTSRLGIKPKYAQTTFDGLIPGVASHRYDMIGSIGDYAERHKQVTFIDYMVKGVSIVVTPENPHHISKPNDLCGLTVTFVRGVYAGELAKQTSKKCKDNGHDGITLKPLKNTAATALALESGRADAEWADSPDAAYRAKTKPNKYKVAYFKKVGPYGIGLPKDAKQLTKAIRTALLGMAEDGAFKKIMNKWGLKDNMLSKFPMNQGPKQD